MGVTVEIIITWKDGTQSSITGLTQEVGIMLLLLKDLRQRDLIEHYHVDG